MTHSLYTFHVELYDPDKHSLSAFVMATSRQEALDYVIEYSIRCTLLEEYDEADLLTRRSSKKRSASTPASIRA